MSVLTHVEKTTHKQQMLWVGIGSQKEQKANAWVLAVGEHKPTYCQKIIYQICE